MNINNATDYLEIMFSDLPKDVQELVWRKMEVKDRAKLSVVLPKGVKVNMTCCKAPAKEKQLSVLIDGIRKKKIQRLTPKMIEFVTTYGDSEDANVTEIRNAFPDHFVRDANARTMTLSENIKTGKITSSEAASITYNMLNVFT